MNPLKNKKVRLVIITLIAVLLAWGSISYLMQPKLAFVFDTTKVSNWWHGDNNYGTDASQPVVGMVAMQGTRENPGGCFITTALFNGTVNVAEKLQQQQDGMVMGRNASVLTSLGTIEQSIQTPEGLKTYALHRFDLNLPETLRANSFGYIQLEDSYIEIRGVCRTLDQFNELYAALPAFSLTK